MVSFHVIATGPDGRHFVASDSPKLDAYRYASILRLMQGRAYSLDVDASGDYTVSSPGLLPLTFTARVLPGAAA